MCIFYTAKKINLPLISRIVLRSFKLRTGIESNNYDNYFAANAAKNNVCFYGPGEHYNIVHVTSRGVS